MDQEDEAAGTSPSRMQGHALMQMPQTNNLMSHRNIIIKVEPPLVDPSLKLAAQKTAEYVVEAEESVANDIVTSNAASEYPFAYQQMSPSTLLPQYTKDSPNKRKNPIQSNVRAGDGDRTGEGKPD